MRIQTALTRLVGIGGADQVSYPAYAEAPILEHALGEPFSTQWVDDGFAMAGVTRNDMDVVQLYDGFASWIVMQWEMLGFCEPGEGGRQAGGRGVGAGFDHHRCQRDRRRRIVGLLGVSDGAGERRDDGEREGTTREGRDVLHCRGGHRGLR